jgi:iron complex outermembrane receptor protein
MLNSVYAEQALAPVEIIAIEDKEIVNVPIIGHQQRIEREVFANTYLPLDELLEQQAGIDIQSVGGNGQYSFPTIRGSSGKQVLIFWDGLLINDLNGGSADIGSLSLSSAGNIDIYRGMSPIELSPTAVGGAINIQSQNLNANSGESGITLGSFNTKEFFVTHNISNKSASFLFNINSFSSENDFMYLESAPVSSPNFPAYESRKNNGVSSNSLLMKSHYTFRPQLRIDGSLQYQKGKREISSRINTSTNNANLEQEGFRLQSGLTRKSEIFGKTLLRVSTQRNEELYDDEKSNVGLGSQYNLYETNKTAIKLQHEIDANNLSLVFTTGYERETVETRFPHDKNLPDSCSLGGKCEVQFERKAIHAGSRINLDIVEAFNFMLQIGWLQYDDRNRSNNADDIINEKNASTTYDSGLSYHFLNGAEIFIKAGKQVRQATSDELFGDKGTSKGNADLVAEKSDYKELGLAFSNSLIAIDMSLYQRILTDSITPSTDSRGIIKFENVAKTEHKGVEITSSLDWNRHWQSSANLTFQSNKILEHTLDSHIGNQMGDYSQTHQYLSTRWQMDEISIRASRTFQTGGYYNSTNTLKRDTKSEWNLSFTWQEEDWLFSLEGKNLTSDRAQDFPSIPEPGRQFYAKFIYNW